MADIDILPKRAVPAAALVDSNGIASNGSLTTTQLARRGMASLCAVDGTGTSLLGATLGQIAKRGIQTFCPVDELGVAQDASTADQLRKRGISPMVLLDPNGIALTGTATMETLRKRSLGYFCPVDEAGNATTMGAVILISNTTVLDNATIGSTVGTLSVAGGTGTYTFTLTSNPGSLFATAGTNGVNLNVAAALTAGIKPITVQAAGGVPTPISRTINITVTQSPTLPVNTVAPVIAGTPQEGQTLTVTNNGTWTGSPAPGFTYQWNRNPSVSAEVSQWLARATGLDAAHIAADTAFIDGLVAANLWSKFDVLHVYATQNTATAQLNLLSSSYPATLNGSPTFTTDRGYTGVDSSATVYINTGFNPSTASSPKFVQNSAHMSMWNLINGTSVTSAGIGGTSSDCYFAIKYTDGNSYGRMMMGAGGTSAANSDPRGHHIINRSDAANVQVYKTGASFTTTANGSSAPPNLNIYSLGLNNGGTPLGTSHQFAMFSIGSSLNATDATAFYNLVRIRLTAVGVP